MASSSYLTACERPSLLRLLISPSQRAKVIVNAVNRGIRTVRRLKAITSQNPAVSDTNPR